jgi:hypothetical protein
VKLHVKLEQGVILLANASNVAMENGVVWARLEKNKC